MKIANCKHVIAMIDTLVLTGDDPEVKRESLHPTPT